MGRASPQDYSSETALAPKLPLRLGRFTLCEEVGAGGMATVYLARMDLAAGLDRLVALKTIHPHLAKEKPFVDMFLDEARIASHVSHPNVCATYDFGEVGGVYYLAMEYLLGEPLFDVINRVVDRFEETREVLPYLAARIIADACEGLHAAHSARGPNADALHIVHRDVSPQNLFLTYEGSTKVVDFGCAKAAERVAHTSTGVMKGKVGYAAPEQLKSDEVDARADVWALGVCLWETVTLSPLFSRDTAVATAMAVLQDDIELASTGRDWVPEELARIADRALRRDRTERYASARDLSRDLRRFIADSGFSLESAELAEWMDFLFDDRHEKRIAQAERVREMDLSDASTGRLYEVTDEEVELIDTETPPLLAVPIGDDHEPLHAGAPLRDAARSGRRERGARGTDDDTLAVAKSAPSRADEVQQKSPNRRLLVALVALAVVGIGGYLWQLYFEPAPWLLELLSSSDAAAGTPSVTPDRPRRHERRGPRGEGAAAGRSGSPVAPNDAPELVAGEETDEASGEARAPDAPVEPTTDEPPAEPAAPVERPRRRDAPRVTTVSSGGGTSYGFSPEPAPAPVQPATPRASSGFVSVRASGGGWAMVYDGPRSLGRTPVHAELPEGTHRLRILPFGREPAETVTVRVEAGLEESLTIDVGEPG